MALDGADPPATGVDRMIRQGRLPQRVSHQGPPSVELGGGGQASVENWTDAQADYRPSLKPGIASAILLIEHFNASGVKKLALT